jgi:hypothetical protein
MGVGEGARAQFPIPLPAFDYTRYPEIRHNVPLIRQDTVVWCWVAAAKMILDWRGSSPNQCSMLQQQYGAPCCLNPALCARPGHIAEIGELIRRFGGRPSSVAPPANGFILYDALRRGPIVMHTREGHFIVATGMRVEPSPYGPLGVVLINDPFRGSFAVPFPELIMMWDAALVVGH